MFIFTLGRQAEISLAELRAVFGNAELILPNVAIVKTEVEPNIDCLGSVRKAGQIIWDQLGSVDANKFLLDKFSALPDGKITLAISNYGRSVSAGSAQKTGNFLKKNLNRSVRILPNSEPEISDAAALGNRLGSSPNKIELMMVRSGHRLIIAQLIGVQNLDSYTLRDRGRPKRDARVGMLPPKLAQTMINLAVGLNFHSDKSSESFLSKEEHGELEAIKQDLSAALRMTKSVQDDKQKVLLDPFCGTGVVLQEAALMGFRVYGTDLEPRIIEFTNENLDWLSKKFHLNLDERLLTCVGDATKFDWLKLIAAMNQQNREKKSHWPEKIDFVATETYLGRPYSSVPSEENLRENITNCEIILTKFLANLRQQITDQTGLCVAVPCWFVDGRTRHLPLTRKLTEFGFEQISYSSESRPLIYHRENQIVGRELLVLRKKS